MVTSSSVVPQLIGAAPLPAGYLTVGEKRPCVTCGERFQPGQLFVPRSRSRGPFHLACDPARGCLR
jgi:hypothetical protein